MPNLNVEKCPETGICSIVKADGRKVDLIASEVAQLQDAGGDESRVKELLGSIDSSFAAGLTSAEIAQLAANV